MLVFLVFCLAALTACSHVDSPDIPYITSFDEHHLRDDWKVHFENKKTQGCFVLFDLAAGDFQVFNVERAKEAMTPASTFKIPNSVIALDSGVVRSRKQIFVWDGEKQFRKSWERAHDLDSAFRFSVVPVYQEIARAVGAQSMAEYVEGFDYGNCDISGEIDQFWLNNTLKISAFEQVAFLERLYRESLPASIESQKSVKEMMLHEKTESYTIRGKTGWALGDESGLGWWVGWVETNNNVHLFALNMDLKEVANAGNRVGIAKGILKAEGLLQP